MPILNGFEAGEKISDLFLKDNSPSHTDLEDGDQQIPHNQMIQRRRGGLPSPNKVLKKNRNRKCPFMLACSSTPDSQELQERLKACGFNMYIEQPLDRLDIQTII